MSPDIPLLIQRYLDDELTYQEYETLSRWIRSDEENTREFSAMVQLHDRLRDEFSRMNLVHDAKAQQPTRFSGKALITRWTRSSLGWATAASVLLLTSLFFWQIFGVRSVSAAVELNRIIAASSAPIDRIFSIAVEETTLPGKRRPAPVSKLSRPPKPSIDGALLHLRGSNQFVLKRQIDEDQFFVTGCNGKTSWAVRPDGPARVSSDITRFTRDLPGHEHAMPLNNLHDGLEQLREAYQVSVIPAEIPEKKADVDEDASSRLLVAVKKRGFRGPKRIEISYMAATGLIEQIRFVEMPYGPERLTIRMTLVEERDLGATFFDHEAHHDGQRTVEVE